MCSYRWSEHISHICSLYVLSLLCCQDWFLNSFFWFLKGSWHCSHSFGLADFAPTISLSMIAFICLESRGFGTLEMMTYTWRSHSVSFVYNFVSVDLRVCWPFLRLSCSFFFFSFFPESCVVSLRKLHVTQNVLDWCKHNSDFCIVDICHLILEYILKCFVVHHFNSYCSLCFFVGWDLLLAVYFIFLLRSGNDVRKFKWSDFLMQVQNGS